MKRTPIDEVEPVGVLAERTTTDGRRQIQLREDERRDFQELELVNKAIALFLDIRSKHTYKEIADELGVGIVKLKELTKTKLFMEKYDEYFGNLGSDPRLKATRGEILDMVSLATEGLRSLISPGTPPTVRLNAIKEVYRLAGLEENSGVGSDRDEAAKFLKNMGVNVEQLNVNVDNPYARQMEQYASGQYVEGQHETLKNNPDANADIIDGETRDITEED